MTRKNRRRLRVITARAMMCAVLFAALGATGYRDASDPDGTDPGQSASIAP
ncbi:hypothetical protein LVB87_13930 [Lysobacter sp. KIS68-7]|uniref:hypothetical protein n=1 Tax=Lysobacter sp. KIS68-7 TaxID=2904252 RepID=UPI001E4026DB|nr:hypothetical protein [Lysobacter sp. KIS68-7]UHQ19267.1 hypothetical protein LVB87_13930 [Lysobacter sp. KIS68-7]